MKDIMEALGIHYLAEYHGCDPALIDNPAYLEEIMRDAAVRAGATIVQSFFHRFNPHGVSGVIIIAESHFTIHCWPERGYAAADFFSCGHVEALAALNLLGDGIAATSRAISSIKRGAGINGSPPSLHTLSSGS